MRFRRRWLLAILLLPLLLLAFGVWRLSRDDERLTRWLQSSVQSATGLAMETDGGGRFGFWPRLSVALDGVRLSAPGEAQPVAKIGALRVQVPWSGIFGHELRVSGIGVDDAVIDAAALDAWRARQSEAGPMPALRWPELDAALDVRRLRYRRDDVDVFALERLRLNRWRIDRDADLDATFTLAALGAAPFQLKLGCTPRQTRTSIAIEPCSATIEREGSATLSLRGYLRHDDAARGESQLRVEAPTLPDWIVVAPLELDAAPIDLALRSTGAFAGPLKLKLGGALAGSAVDVDVVLPFDWTGMLAGAQWNTLAERTIGHARIDRLRIEGAALDDVEWRNDAPDAGTATTTGAMQRR